MKEGDSVTAGDVLYELASGSGLDAGQPLEDQLLADLRERRSALRAELEAMNARFENESALLASTSLANGNEIRQLRIETQALAMRLVIAEGQRDKSLTLVETGALAESDAMVLEDRVAARRAALASKQQVLERVQSSLETWPLQRQRLASERKEQRAAILERIHALGMEESRLLASGDGRILAPRSGRIASIRIRNGEWTRPGQRLLDILPNDAELEARLFASGSAIGAITVGQTVRVYLDAFPYERHGAQTGRVRSISETTLTPAEASAQGAPAGAFRIDVEFPDGFDLTVGQRRALRPGMTVRSDFVGGHGTLIDWLFDPLRSAAERI